MTILIEAREINENKDDRQREMPAIVKEKLRGASQFLILVEQI
jgi:hypothetical protein